MSWLPVVGPIIEKVLSFIPDPEQRAKAELAARQADYDAEVKQIELAISADKMQADINLEQAKHQSLFVAGARPFIMWACGIAYAYHFCVQPMLAFAIANIDRPAGSPVVLPFFDMDSLNWVLFGLLGLGSLRTLEKVKGVTK